MTKRKLLIRFLIMLILIGLMLPSFMQRVSNEAKNNDCIFALNYNNAVMVLSGEEFDKSLDENMKNGVKTVLVGEESINSLISAGYVTGIKYNVLCHKYDDESEDIIKLLKGDKKIHNDSYVLITKRPDSKAYLDKWISAKYSDDEYVKVKTPLDADVYLLYEGFGNAWQVTTGFDEQKISYAHEKGFDIVLSMMLGAYTQTDYIEHVAELVDKYDIRFINLKEVYKDENGEKSAKKNIDAFCKMIKEKELYLILTENQTQLSNQKPIGYEKLVESADGRVLRGYETADFLQTNTGATISEMRYSQIFNSVIDRNIRFVTINQLTNGTDSFGEKSEKTNAATKAALDKLSEAGYNTQSYDMQYDYSVNRRMVSAAAMVLIILMCLTILEWLCGKKLPKIEILAAIGAVLSIPFSYVAPVSIVLLYPTLFAVVAPCFAFTAVMIYIKNMRTRLSNAMFLISSVLVALVVLMLCGIVQSSLLSGLDYYLNSIIFRGIKLSLVVPIAYSAFSYGIIFSDKSEKGIDKVIKILNSQIKVYWVIIGAVVAAAGAIYLIRSGNVKTISPLESFMRNAITEIMPARPRTKEFLVGWPCLVLLLYYIKNTDCRILQWCFSVGSSILFASVINSFCHVFTSAATIYMRVINGLLIGAVISLVLLVINEVIVRMVKKYIITGKE